MQTRTCGFSAALLCAAAAALGAQGIERVNGCPAVVRFQYRVVNKTDKAQDATIACALPQGNARQDVRALCTEDDLATLTTDRYGNRFATYAVKDLKPGEVRQFGWIAAVQVYAAVWNAASEKQTLGDEERAHYTRDLPMYAITSPVITQLRDDLARQDMSDARKARALFDHVAARIDYVRDGVWDPAPDVLTRGKGSCSEYSYALIALLRACRIPCRYAGALILTEGNCTKYDAGTHEDAVFHRWVEIHLDDYGWFPADGSRAHSAVRRFENVANHIGRLPAGLLETYHGDGGEDTPLIWEYVANFRCAEKDALQDVSSCVWLETRSDDLPKDLARVKAALEAAETAEAFAGLLATPLERELVLFLLPRVPHARYPALAGGLLAARHPDAVYIAACCEREGIALPPALTSAALTDRALGAEIKQRARNEPKAWAAFEYWWRKARALVAFSEDKKVFTLTTTSIDIH